MNPGRTIPECNIKTTSILKKQHSPAQPKPKSSERKHTKKLKILKHKLMKINHKTATSKILI